MENTKNNTFNRPVGSAKPETQSVGTEQTKPLMRNNFILMAVSILLIVIGFVLMSGKGSTLEEYNRDIFSTRRIVIGPMISFIGYVLMAIAIVVKPKAKA